MFLLLLSNLSVSENSSKPRLSSSGGTGINNAGQVVGTAGSHAVVWTQGGATTLDSLEQYGSVGNGINDSGQVTGSSNTVLKGTISVISLAVVWSPSGVTADIVTLRGYSSSDGNGINNAGQVVVGYSTTAEGGLYPFVWEDGKMYNLNSIVNLA